MFDFATSVNSYILQNSRKYYWADLTCNIFSVVLAIPLNYLLIKSYGIIGAALAYLVLSLISNTFKALFLYFKEKIHPFSNRWWLLFGVFVAAIILSYILNYLFDLSIFDNLVHSNVTRIIRIAIRSVILCGIFIPIVYWLNISDDISEMIKLLVNKLSFKKG
jgi:peptidoglycan biosynthesis protein MviN/MurJ (putative lipid II flippase)